MQFNSYVTVLPMKIYLSEVLIFLDIKNTETFNEFTNKVQNIVQEDGLNVLLNNAGYSPKSTRINMLKPEQMMETFQINTVGPIMLTKVFYPQIFL